MVHFEHADIGARVVSYNVGHFSKKVPKSIVDPTKELARILAMVGRK